VDKPHLVTADPNGLDLLQPATGPEPGTRKTEKTEPMPIDLLCRACGERGGNWLRGPRIKLGHVLTLGSNQRIALCADESGTFVYTHICAEWVGIDLPGVGVIHPGESSRPSCAGRDGAVDEIGERSPDLVGGDLFGAGNPISIVITPAGIRELRRLAELDFNPDEKEAVQTRPEAGGGIRPLKDVARELLGALYAMIGIFGMPTGREAADEVRAALVSAEAAKVDEVLL
jgi:hypothetical protein